jgi:hypothetical protein
MTTFDFQITPAVFALWVMAAPCLVIAIRLSFDSGGGVIRLLSYNAITLAIFCALWYLGFYLSEYWMRVIDLGSPWPWFGVLVAASFAVSFWQLRGHSMRIAKSLVGPVITAPAFWLWIIFCAIKFDPFW